MYKQTKTKYEELKAEFKELAANGADGYEIIRCLGITPKQAKQFHYDLLASGEIPAQVKLRFASLGEPVVAKKGNIYITVDRLDSLGLSEILAPLTSLKFSRDGDALRIEALSSAATKTAVIENTSAAPDGKKNTESASRWRQFFGRTSHQQNSSVAGN